MNTYVWYVVFFVKVGWFIPLLRIGEWTFIPDQIVDNLTKNGEYAI